jgi:SurA N-terminal domain
MRKLRREAPVPGKKWRLAAAVAAAGACALLAACSPVKAGAAAVVGNQRISQATLDSQVSNLQQDIAQYDPGVQVNTAVLPKLVLGQLISFAVRDRTAQDLGITVSQSDIQQATNFVYQQNQQSGSTVTSIQQLITLSAVPVSLKDDFGRYYAIELAFFKSKNGGKLPTTNSAAVQQAASQFSMTECRAAKELNIQVNPQYGQLGFDQTSGHYTVTAGGDTLSAAGGSRPAAVLPYTPAC